MAKRCWPQRQAITDDVGLFLRPERDLWLDIFHTGGAERDE
jgi:hypothetical protein